MVRTIHGEEITTTTTVHPALSFSLLLASVAALTAISVGMCGYQFWRKQDPEEEQEETTTNNHTIEDDKLSDSSSPKPMQIRKDDNQEEDQILSRPLPPPPSATSTLELGDNSSHGKRKPKIDKSSSLNNFMSKSMSTRRHHLTASISMKAPHGMKTGMKTGVKAGVKTARKVKDMEHKVVEELTHIRHKSEEDSIWKKKILMGEKCRFLNRDDEEDEYYEKGNGVVKNAEDNKENLQVQAAEKEDTDSSSSDDEEEDDEEMDDNQEKHENS